MEKNDLENEEFLLRLRKNFEELSSVNQNEASSKLATLKNIETVILSRKDLPFSDGKQNAFLESSMKQLCHCLCEASENCREISARILIGLCRNNDCVKCIVPIIFTTLVRRLGNSDEREPSEEVRLLEVTLLDVILKSYDGDLIKQFNDITGILSMCITDSYPEVRRKSCECTISFSEKQQKSFHMVSTTLLKPLFETVSSQHFKTRSLCVKAIGAVISYGSSQDFNDALSHVAQRLFDHSPVVRSAVTDVIGNWLLTLPDRYSFFSRLIPLILSLLYDEIPDIKAKAESLWQKAGEQYLEENENDYKDLMQFPRPEPKHYPNSVKRPSLGCRILVQRNIHSILPALVRDLKDWNPATRFKSAQVLHSLALHAEDKTNIELSLFLEGAVTAAKDENKDIVKLGIRCAELLGFFLDPNLVCDSVMTLVYKSPSAVHLSVFAAVLRGNKKGLPTKCSQAICKLLADPSYCRLREAEQQANLLLCIDGLLSSGIKIEFIISHQIFTILCSVSGLTTNNCIIDKVDELLKELACQQSISMEELFKAHGVSLVTTLAANNEIWTQENPELPIFYFLVQSEFANEEVLKSALPVIINNLNLNKDVKLRSKILTLLIKVFQKLPSSEDKEINEKVLELICLGIFPNLTWSPGKAASSLRTIAIASLYEIVRKDCIDKCMLEKIANELLPLLATLSGDDEVSNRLLACKILEFLLPKLYGCVDDHKIHFACHDFLQCMDDASDDIRIMTTRVLKAYIKAFPSDYCWSAYRSYLKEMFHNVLIHMDDKNEKIRESVLSLLKDVAHANPKLLLDEIEEKRYLMAAGDCCDKLIEHIKNLHV